MKPSSAVVRRVRGRTGLVDHRQRGTGDDVLVEAAEGAFALGHDAEPDALAGAAAVAAGRRRVGRVGSVSVVSSAAVSVGSVSASPCRPRCLRRRCGGVAPRRRRRCRTLQRRATARRRHRRPSWSRGLSWSSFPLLVVCLSDESRVHRGRGVHGHDRGRQHRRSPGRTVGIGRARSIGSPDRARPRRGSRTMIPMRPSGESTMMTSSSSPMTVLNRSSASSARARRPMSASSGMSRQVDVGADEHERAEPGTLQMARCRRSRR